MLKDKQKNLDFNTYLSKDYNELVKAFNKITGNNDLAIDLLHYAIEECSYKSNLQDIIDSGGMRFYLVRIGMTQWRSKTGPFYKAFIKSGGTVDVETINISDEKEETIDIKRVESILNQLPWYDATLFKLYVEGQHNFSSLARETGIPRTSIGLTLNRVKKHIKKHL